MAQLIWSEKYTTLNFPRLHLIIIKAQRPRHTRSLSFDARIGARIFAPLSCRSLDLSSCAGARSVLPGGIILLQEQQGICGNFISTPSNSHMHLGFTKFLLPMAQPALAFMTTRKQFIF